MGEENGNLRMTYQTDLFLSAKDRLWLWMQTKKLFSSIDLAKYAVQFYNLRSGRQAREWCEGDNPRLKRLSNQEKLFMGLVKDGNANIAWYKLNEKYNNHSL